MESSRLAVLIDAENIPAKYADGLFAEVAKLGEASVRRADGDFSNSSVQSWAGNLTRHAIVPCQQFSNCSGKNATDILLVMDAMDLLHAGHLDGICLVSSDSDFTGLAMRIRERSIDVFGFGEKKTPVSFQKACNRFIFIERLELCSHSNTKTAKPAPKAAKPSPKTAKPAPLAAKPSPENDEQLATALDQAFERLECTDGWVHMSALGSQLRLLIPGFKSSNYGPAKLSSLLDSLKTYQTKPGKGTTILVCKNP